MIIIIVYKFTTGYLYIWKFARWLGPIPCRLPNSYRTRIRVVSQCERGFSSNAPVYGSLPSCCLRCQCLKLRCSFSTRSNVYVCVYNVLWTWNSSWLSIHRSPLQYIALPRQDNWERDCWRLQMSPLCVEQTLIHSFIHSSVYLNNVYSP